MNTELIATPVKATMALDTLRELAKDHGVEGAETMTKAQLVKAIKFKRETYLAEKEAEVAKAQGAGLETFTSLVNGVLDGSLTVDQAEAEVTPIDKARKARAKGATKASEPKGAKAAPKAKAAAKAKETGLSEREQKRLVGDALHAAAEALAEAWDPKATGVSTLNARAFIEGWMAYVPRNKA